MKLAPALPPHAEATIHQFLRHHLAEAGAQGMLLGLSGGIDSALTARLAVDALGAARVRGVIAPDTAYPAALLEETQAYGRALGIETTVVPIAEVEAAFRHELPTITDRMNWGNTKARIRMVLSYALAREARSLVLGTGNKSEILLGYFTKYGDGGVDLLPLGDLYKTQVGALAEQLGLPEPIRARAPTAGLYEGQTDEAELGMPYRDLDQVLHDLEGLRTVDEIASASGLPIDAVRAVEARVAANRHKRRSAPIPKIGLRTVGIDWRD
ncbi:MAG: NAD+ synthase [Thermoplasmata archaeon]|nr:NAD+ synthase [Thermoplasmata archaeon]